MTDPRMRASTPPTVGPGPLFNDVHSVLQNVTQDISALRRLAQESDEVGKKELEALRQKVLTEKREHREHLNRFRYEYEEFVHVRVQQVIENIESIGKSERKGQGDTLIRLNALQEELAKLKDHTYAVSSKWTRFSQRVKHDRPSAVSAAAALEADSTQEHAAILSKVHKARERVSENTFSR
eukprot:TRINITY_DN4574_c0_g1_i1.p1 TRINITY_DN4574_c0_g1~~TRINITY_DN4574_c0_g1_i1.p1  ORF type:complete len:197 (-),score=18.53 TRINITY_DN4574_c0_g1_i1:97-642(-)